MAFDKSIGTLFNSLRHGYNSGCVYLKIGKDDNEGFPSGCLMLYSVMKNTCFKGSKYSCIDLVITNSKFAFIRP